MTNYTDFPGLADGYLEDSFVLAIDETPTALSFRLETALTIPEATKIEWVTRSTQTYGDATGEEDLGNIDSLQHHGDHYEIAGDWGHVRIYSAAAPHLTFTEGAKKPPTPT